MHPSTRAGMLSSLTVMLYVAAPATIMLTAHETVRIDRLAYSAPGEVTASRHGDLLRPGTSTIRLDRGTYHFRTAGDARLHVADPDSVMVVTSPSEKVIDPQAVPQPGPGGDIVPLDGKKGGGLPDRIPALTVTCGDAA